MNFEQRMAAPCGLMDGNVALDEGLGSAWPPRPINERIDVGADAAMLFQKRHMIDVEFAHCDADLKGYCCELAVPIERTMVARGRLRYRAWPSPIYASPAEDAALENPTLCLAP
jgi:hypothetical protein